MRNNDSEERQRILLGMGFDNKDGHKRLTKGEDFVLMGGSEATHEKMTETAIKVSEKLAKKGRTIRTASDEELRDIFGELNS
ncbi:MAG: hypothetical protein E7047_03340 [Lentisphaerae bacterium]|nr:hypothetical protein [Lentisphaerota bacterium]